MKPFSINAASQNLKGDKTYDCDCIFENAFGEYDVHASGSVKDENMSLVDFLKFVEATATNLQVASPWVEVPLVLHDNYGNAMFEGILTIEKRTA